MGLGSSMMVVPNEDDTCDLPVYMVMAKVQNNAARGEVPGPLTRQTRATHTRNDAPTERTS